MNHMIRTAAAFSLAVLISTCPSRAQTDTCNTTGLWVDSVVCDSEILIQLDSEVTGRFDGLAARLKATTPELASAVTADQAAWRTDRAVCKKQKLPQQCMEWRYYARNETAAYLANLLTGPRRFGDPLQVCWQKAEGERDAQKCLDRRLSDIRTGLGIIAVAVRTALVKRDAETGSAGDAVSSFDAAQRTFPLHANAACLSEAAALGQGPGRMLGQTACAISAWQARAKDILRFLPDLPAHWSSDVRLVQDDIAKCLDHGRGLKLGGPIRVSGFAATADGRSTTRVTEQSGARHDCTLSGQDRSVESFAAVTDGTPGSSENLVFYSTVADGPVAQECFVHDRVFDRSGAHSGWLSFRIC